MSFKEDETKEDVVRKRLLFELSALRRHICGIMRNGGAEERDGMHESVLDQSDRDAIEAFFQVDDDFTKQFNEGTGNIKRADLIPMDL